MEPVWLFSFGRSQKDVRLVDCDVTSCIFQIKEDWLKAEKIQKQIKAKYEKNVKKILIKQCDTEPATEELWRTVVFTLPKILVMYF